MLKIQIQMQIANANILNAHKILRLFKGFKSHYIHLFIMQDANSYAIGYCMEMGHISFRSLDRTNTWYMINHHSTVSML